MNKTTVAVRYSAVAITAEGELIPFGPTFASEQEAWYWLHYECSLTPKHREIDVWALA